MKYGFTTLGFQVGESDSSMWIIIIAVIVVLFLIVAIVLVGLIIFFVMRKRKKAQGATAPAAIAMSSDYSESLPASLSEEAIASPEAAIPFEATPPILEPSTPIEEIQADVSEGFSPAPFVPPADSGALDFDPTRTVAINRESTVTISYGRIRFVSGALAGQEFDVDPAGAYIGRESSLSQIVVPDPRISKRHLWIGVRDGLVRIIDQESRNGTFVNDPKSERITEATLNTGDTVIMGESDVARFEYQT